MCIHRLTDIAGGRVDKHECRDPGTLVAAGGGHLLPLGARPDAVAELERLGGLAVPRDHQPLAVLGLEKAAGIDRAGVAADEDHLDLLRARAVEVIYEQRAQRREQPEARDGVPEMAGFTSTKCANGSQASHMPVSEGRATH